MYDTLGSILTIRQRVRYLKLPRLMSEIWNLCGIFDERCSGRVVVGMGSYESCWRWK